MHFYSMSVVPRVLIFYFLQTHLEISQAYGHTEAQGSEQVGIHFSTHNCASENLCTEVNQTMQFISHRPLTKTNPQPWTHSQDAGTLCVPLVSCLLAGLVWGHTKFLCRVPCTNSAVFLSFLHQSYFLPSYNWLLFIETEVDVIPVKTNFTCTKMKTNKRYYFVRFRMCLLLV